MPLKRFTSTSAEQCERVLHGAFVISKKCNKIIVSEEIREALFGGTVLKEGWSLDGSE